MRDSPQQPRTASTDLKRFSAEEKSANKLVDTSAPYNPLAPIGVAATSGSVSCYGKSSSVLTPSNRQSVDMEWDPFFGPPVVKGSLPTGVFPWAQCRGKTVSITPAALPKAPRLPPRSSAEVATVADRRESPSAAASGTAAKQPVGSSSILIHSSRTETNFVDIPGSSSMTWNKPVSTRTSHSTPFTIGTPTQVERDESMTLLSPSAPHDEEHPLTSLSDQQPPRVAVTQPSADPESNPSMLKGTGLEPRISDAYLSVHPPGEAPVPTEPLHEGSFNSSIVSHASVDSREPLVA